MNLWRRPGCGPSPEPGVTTWLSAARRDTTRGRACPGCCPCRPRGGRHRRLPLAYLPRIRSQPEPHGISPGKSLLPGAWIGSLMKQKQSLVSLSLTRFSMACAIPRATAGAWPRCPSGAGMAGMACPVPEATACPVATGTRGAPERGQPGRTAGQMPASPASPGSASRGPGSLVSPGPAPSLCGCASCSGRAR
jgi:hypothetical protein